MTTSASSCSFIHAARSDVKILSVELMEPLLTLIHHQLITTLMRT